MNALPDTLLPIHIAAVGQAMVRGAVALMAKKGGTMHRRSGLLSSTPGSSWASAPRLPRDGAQPA